MADTLARLEGYLLAHLSADRRGSPAGRRCGRRVLWPSSGFSGRDRIGFFVWIVRKSLRYRRATVTPCRNSPTGRHRYPARTDRAAERRKRGEAWIRLHLWTYPRLVERERGYKGDHGRPKRRL